VGGRAAPIVWPYRSSDLTPLEYRFMGICYKPSVRTTFASKCR
jgi:hypothetical protein